eukprot:m.238621 g.238621  ORF g.238621 m.238621 type:complete len:396 (-) comp26236_c0_seq10:8-1195(-)
MPISRPFSIDSVALGSAAFAHAVRYHGEVSAGCLGKRPPQQGGHCGRCRVQQGDVSMQLGVILEEERPRRLGRACFGVGQFVHHPEMCCRVWKVSFGGGSVKCVEDDVGSVERLLPMVWGGAGGDVVSHHCLHHAATPTDASEYRLHMRGPSLRRVGVDGWDRPFPARPNPAGAAAVGVASGSGGVRGGSAGGMPLVRQGTTTVGRVCPRARHAVWGRDRGTAIIIVPSDCIADPALCGVLCSAHPPVPSCPHAAIKSVEQEEDDKGVLAQAALPRTLGAHRLPLVRCELRHLFHQLGGGGATRPGEEGVWSPKRPSYPCSSRDLRDATSSRFPLPLPPGPAATLVNGAWRDTEVSTRGCGCEAGVGTVKSGHWLALESTLHASLCGTPVATRLS